MGENGLLYISDLCRAKAHGSYIFLEACLNDSPETHRIKTHVTEVTRPVSNFPLSSEPEIDLQLEFALFQNFRSPYFIHYFWLTV